MMKRVMIVFLLILLVGGTVGGLTSLKIIPDVLGINTLLSLFMGEPSGEVAEAPPPPPDYGPEPQFMQLPQLAIPLITGGRSETFLMLSLRLHVDTGNKSQVTRAAPRLRDAYITGLIKELPKIQERSGRLDLASIKAVINVLTRKVLGDGVVHDVLIENAFAR